MSLMPLYLSLFYLSLSLYLSHLYICIVCMYIWLNCIYLYLNVYCQCLMLTVCTKGQRVTQFQFSVCMYCTCGRIDNKAVLTWLDLIKSGKYKSLVHRTLTAVIKCKPNNDFTERKRVSRNIMIKCMSAWDILVCGPAAEAKMLLSASPHDTPSLGCPRQPDPQEVSSQTRWSHAYKTLPIFLADCK